MDTNNAFLRDLRQSVAALPDDQVKLAIDIARRSVEGPEPRLAPRPPLPSTRREPQRPVAGSGRYLPRQGSLESNRPADIEDHAARRLPAAGLVRGLPAPGTSPGYKGAAEAWSLVARC